MQAGWTILALSLFTRPQRSARLRNVIVIVVAAALTWLLLIAITQFAISVA